MGEPMRMPDIKRSEVAGVPKKERRAEELENLLLTEMEIDRTKAIIESIHNQLANGSMSHEEGIIALAQARELLVEYDADKAVLEQVLMGVNLVVKDLKRVEQQLLIVTALKQDPRAN